ncbi:MerR family transcriptional regulator [Bacillus sp. BGMRC 2118]|nr:MerR family transcriptional regulator [Bacillus sp. BGMRC 2118]
MGELAQIAGVSKRTIDYYTQMNLLTYIRTNSNYRLYEDCAVQELNLIEHYKTLNMPLSKVKETLELMNKKDCSEDINKIEQHIEQVMNMIQHLQEEMNELKPLIERLNDVEKEALMMKFSPHSIELAQSILAIFKDK